MSLPRYPQYKEFDSEWLREIPAHWESEPCRYFVIEQTAKNENAANQAYLSLMANVGIIPYEEKGDVGNKKPEDLSKCKLVAEGDLVINSMNYGIGSYGLSGLDGVCSPVYIVLRPRLDRARARFAFRVFENRAFQTHAQSFGNGILEHRAAINWDILKGIKVGVPPIEEQDAILTFLDRETAKIDALIAEQEKLIALLAEKRQATISHAVTKGLNPDVPMKDSGVPWLGEVPAHWEINRLKSISPQITVGIVVEPSKYYVGSGVPALRSLNVAPGRVIEDNFVFISAESNDLLSKSRLRAGDLVSVRSGQTGTTAVVPENLNGCNCIDLIIIRKPRDDSEQFLCWFLGSDAAIQQFSSGSGGAIQQHFNIGTAMNLQIARPPRKEQDAIVKFLEIESDKIESLHRASEHSINLLQERRSALIAAAVTGQIDVRGLY